MRKLIWILLILPFFIPDSVYSFHQTSANYDSLYYYGSGGFVETTATQDIGGGIGQTVIGEINKDLYNHAIFYGIFWINTTYTSPIPTLFPFIFSIYDYRMETITLNWSSINVTTLGPSTCS